jgi:general nucleoside transport system permease protein
MLDIILSTLRLSLPVLLAASGGYFTEKTGVAQISLEAYLLTGAFTAAAVGYVSHSTTLGYILAIVMGVLVSQLFSLLVLKLKANAIVVGTALNLLVMGVIPIISKNLFDSTGSTPSFTTNGTVGIVEIYPYVLTSLLLALSYYLAERSKWGLEIKFAGQNSEVLESVGISPTRVRWQAITFSAAITAAGGALLSTYLASSYSPMMSAGRGFIALAAVIFAGWRLGRAWLVVLFFALTEALQIYLQSMQLDFKIPNELIQSMPYLITLLVLLFYRNKSSAPRFV